MDSNTALEYMLSRLRPHVEDLKKIEEMVFSMKIGDTNFTINFENRIKDYEKRKEIALLDEFCQKILTPHEKIAWSHAQEKIYWILESKEVELGDVIKKDFSGKLFMVLAIVSKPDGGMVYVSKSMLKEWDKELSFVEEVAHTNLKAEIKKSTLTELKTDYGSYWFFETPNTFLKASFILENECLEKIKNQIGSDVLFLAPNRDTLFILKQGSAELLGRVANVCYQNFLSVSYPLSTEYYGEKEGKITDLGIYGK